MGYGDEPGQWFVNWLLADVRSRNRTAYDLETRPDNGGLASATMERATPSA
jgi:hypothetical protein